MDKEARLNEILDQPRMFNHVGSVERQQVGRPFYEVVKKHFKPHFHVAEIGSYSGGSTEILALCCEKVYSIDPYTDNDNPIQEGLTMEDALKNLSEAERIFIEKMSKYPNVIKIRKLSMEAVRDFEDNSLDAVYIDGNHRYDSVVADMAAWWPKVKDGGIVAGHDYYENIALAVSNARGVPHEVFDDSSFVFVKGQKNPQKFLVKTVQDSDSPNGKYGLFAVVFQALGVLDSAKNGEHVSVVMDGKSPYYDPARGGNPWYYYFAQPSRFMPEYVLKDAERGNIPNIRHDAFTECSGTFSFRGGTMDWEPKVVARCRDLCQKYIRIHPAILKKADDFWSAKVGKRTVAGIQVRGTDLWTTGHGHGQAPIDIWHCFKELDKELEKYELAYLVTDEARTLEMFKARYGGRLIHYDDVAFSKTGMAIHHDPKINGYKRGEDVVVESVLLSKCDYILAMSSNIARFATIYNPRARYRFIDRHIKYE